MSRRVDTVLAFAGIGIVVLCLLLSLRPPDRPTGRPPSPNVFPANHPKPQSRSRKIRERIQTRLAAAERQADAALETQLQELHSFFQEVRGRTPQFAALALGFQSKWLCLADHAPGATGDGHRKFLEAKFQEQIFAPPDLQQMLERIVRRYLSELENIDHLLLVEIAADLANLPAGLPEQVSEQTVLETASDKILAQVREQVLRDLGADAGQTVVSVVAGEVLTAAATRLGISSGVLGTGAATSWATLGVGFVACLIVDQVISWVWDWWADPRGQLALELSGKLTALETDLIEGTSECTGLRSRLQEIAKERASLRRKSLEHFLETGEGL